jgi:putative FmdB family regulatory protein
MPRYEYRCRTCDDQFELQRPMADANAPAACPQGHGDAKRLLSMFGATFGGAASPGAATMAAPTGGGCCGGGCGCR